ncbi:hypothetical protein SCP_0105400 [Sparassis crispa]|uniref:Pali-domain-containing protein n=1 Tax=Sparassis crispa TaxID=139825 RepID=A0A401G671_9APHY|nr:hypothetical protein SCP_0105400 [Sparassis crispa]GBE77659.1 hypothetical protein SCP_0105400 [Sparassis crispa]
MGFIRPATPGFLVTLIATGLLALVVFSVPYIKSIYFLKGSINENNVHGSITFGVLGYCLQLPNGTTCSKPSVGYELNVNELLGDNTSIQIPTVLVKWITYALVLHIVAVILSAIAALFGLLAHVREMSMQYCSSFISGFAGSVAFFAFVFDLVLFFVTKSRIKAVSGTATLGAALWLTLASFLLLFFAGCFYGCGRCCIRNREPRDRRKASEPDNRYGEQMRLDAVKAEADRKARQKQGEVGLPAFQELEQTQPLTTRLSDEIFVEDGDHVVPYSRQPSQTRNQYPGGYTQAPAGSSAIDAYYNPNVYPPSPQSQRQPSTHVQGPSGYAASAYSYNAAAAPVAAGAAAGAAAQYLSTAPYSHSQQPTAALENYGHQAGGSSHYAAGAAHQQYPSNYSAPLTDPYSNQSHITQQPYDNLYDSSAYVAAAPMPSTSPPIPAPSTNPYYGQSAQLDRSYTLGGGGYANNVVPDYGNTAAADSRYYGLQGASSSRHLSPPPRAPLNTSLNPPPAQRATSPRGPRSPVLYESPIEEVPQQEVPQTQHYTDAPPMYDAATAQPPGAWSSKR